MLRIINVKTAKPRNINILDLLKMCCVIVFIIIIIAAVVVVVVFSRFLFVFVSLVVSNRRKRSLLPGVLSPK